MAMALLPGVSSFLSLRKRPISNHDDDRTESPPLPTNSSTPRPHNNSNKRARRRSRRSSTDDETTREKSPTTRTPPPPSTNHSSFASLELLLGESSREDDSSETTTATLLAIESSSSSASSSSSLSPATESPAPSPKPPNGNTRIIHRNKVNNKVSNKVNNNFNEHPTEYYSAVSAAKARLHSAQFVAKHSQENLARAQSEVQRSQREVNEARRFLKGVEERWGVISLDDDDGDGGASSSSSSYSAAPFDNEGAIGKIAAGERIAWDNSQSSTALVHHTIQTIRVSNAGESLVNGTYRLQNLPSVPGQTHGRIIYIHDQGPIVLHDQCYDVCLFCKLGYGNKLRWCLGLVPCHWELDSNTFSLKESGNSMEQRCRENCDDVQRKEDVGSNDCGVTNNDQLERRRRWNFALAYIYYWMELPANDVNITIPPMDIIMLSTNTNGNDENYDSSNELLPTSSSSSWGVCHGMRPLPLLEDATDNSGGERKWWQFWRKG